MCASPLHSKIPVIPAAPETIFSMYWFSHPLLNFLYSHLSQEPQNGQSSVETKWLTTRQHRGKGGRKPTGDLWEVAGKQGERKTWEISAVDLETLLLCRYYNPACTHTLMLYS